MRGAATAAEVQELVEQLVAIESVNPTLIPDGGGEAEIGRFVADWLSAHGVETEYRELGDGRANVIGRVKGAGSGRTLLLNAHMDTVALGGTEAGLVPKVVGDRLYGRGAYDMKGSLAAIMLVAAHTVRAGIAGELIVTAVADEEASSIGTEAVAAELRADAAIVTEPTELRVAIAHKGFRWYELETTGRAAHGSRYDLGIDAIASMAPVLMRLTELDERLRAERAPHPLLGGASLHTSTITGGVELSSYPAHCLLTLERRTLPHETSDDVDRALDAAVAGAGTLRMIFAREPLETPPDAEIVRVLQACAADVVGHEPELVGVPFWTDAALLATAGIPTVVYGPAGDGAHADSEWVDLGSVALCIDVLLAVTRRFCGTALATASTG